MAEIKTLRNHAFWWLVVALLSVMFVVLLGWYRWHIHTTDTKLKEWTAPLQDITTTILSQSGTSDDSLIRSNIAWRESLISGLDLTPSVSYDLRHYISNLYTAAGAFDAAKSALPQTNDREYMFNRWTIDLLQTNTLLSGDVIALYSGRETIQDAIRYLSGAVMSTFNTTKKNMSQHNLSVALASQIGVEVLLCTKTYDELSRWRNSISSLFSGLLLSYQNQYSALWVIAGNDTETIQCIAEYRQELANNIRQLKAAMPQFNKLATLSNSRQRAYSNSPLQCPLGVNLRDDIMIMRDYESDVKTLTLQNSLLENMFLTGTLDGIRQACETSSNTTGEDMINLEDMLSALTGSQEQSITSPTGTGASKNTGSYQTLPEDTQKIINDIYQNNIQYIQTMQQTKANDNYNPLERLQELFKEFYGDTKEFIK